MPDLYWGEDATAADFRSRDDAGDLVLAETADGATVLLMWNATASQWEFGGPVDLGGNGLSNVGQVDADELQSDGDILYFGGSGSGLIERLDPSTTTTPYQDAINDIGSNGLIWAPPGGSIEEASTLTGLENRIGLVCPGGFSTIRFTDTANDGVTIGDSANAYSGSYVHGINFDGTDAAGREGGATAAWRFTQSERAFNVGDVYFRGWGDVVVFDGGFPGISRWGYVDFGFSTNHGRNMHTASGGGAPPLTIDAMAAGSGSSGVTNAVLDFRTIQSPVFIGAINYGGAEGSAIWSAGAGSLFVGRLNYEPHTDPSGGYAVTLDGESRDVIHHIRQIGAHTFDGIVQLGPNAGSSRKSVGPIREDGGVTINQSKVVVTEVPTERSVEYQGPRSDVSFTTANQPTVTPVYCSDGEAGVGPLEVSTTATTIDISGTGGLVMVHGQVQGSTPTFTELVSWARSGSSAVVATSERGTPAGRTYTVNNTALELSMASGTYDVDVHSVSFDI